jgi:hypothetical protein
MICGRKIMSLAETPCRVRPQSSAAGLTRARRRRAMKVCSDVGDPRHVVTNAEVSAFLRSRHCAAAPPLRANDAAADRGHMPALAALVLRLIDASPAGRQTPSAVARLRDALRPFRLSAEEVAQIANLRADSDDLLECTLAHETVARLGDDAWGDVRYYIDAELEPAVLT